MPSFLDPLDPSLNHGLGAAEGTLPPVPRVSVVMPVYNGEEHLEPAVESILNQTFRELELLVIDDGSTDRTPELLQDWARSDARVRVHRQNHSGIVAALNRGCGLARAPYLARMDADDIAFPDRLAKQVSFLDEHVGVAVVGGGVEYLFDEGHRIKLKRVPTAPSEIASRLLAGKHCFVHPTVVMRADAFVAVGGYRAPFQWAEDYDLWLRMAERFDLANLEDAVLSKRIHPGQISAHRMEQGIIRLLGAQAAARIRRATGQDPDVHGEVTLATLERLGVSKDLVRDHLVDAYKTNFRAFREAGNPEGALRLFQANTMSWNARRALRTDYASALLQKAKRDYGDRRLMRSFLSILRAFWVRPSLPMAKLVARARSVFAS
jgi:glycosyltransferase involved in cell wall biosynthesis